jgi:hypothetical protein
MAVCGALVALLGGCTSSTEDEPLGIKAQSWLTTETAKMVRCLALQASAADNADSHLPVLQQACLALTASCEHGTSLRPGVRSFLPSQYPAAAKEAGPPCNMISCHGHPITS